MDKLKAIWHILRSKSFFYTCHVGNKYISNHALGNQPKGSMQAFTRVDIMFSELNGLTKATHKHIEKMNERYHNPQFDK